MDALLIESLLDRRWRLMFSSSPSITFFPLRRFRRTGLDFFPPGLHEQPRPLPLPPPRPPSLFILSPRPFLLMSLIFECPKRRPVGWGGWWSLGVHGHDRLRRDTNIKKKNGFLLVLFGCCYYVFGEFSWVLIVRIFYFRAVTDCLIVWLTDCLIVWLSDDRRHDDTKPTF